jgi:hypothetical protein
VYAVNPLQITRGVPPEETGSAISFYQLVRTVAYSIASALSATVLVLYIPRNHTLPSNAGYSAAAVVSTAVLVAVLLASGVFASSAGRHRRPGAGQVDEDLAGAAPASSGDMTRKDAARPG